MDILDDVVQAGLRIVFCGTAAGKHSAALKQPYAGKGNKFWKVIHEIGLTPYQPGAPFMPALAHAVG